MTQRNRVRREKARLARIQIAKATSGAAFVSKKKAAEARMAERAANGQPEIENNGKEDIFEMQHHHLLRCLEKTTDREFVEVDLPFNGAPKRLGSASAAPSPTPSDGHGGIKSTLFSNCCGSNCCKKKSKTVSTNLTTPCTSSATPVSKKGGLGNAPPPPSQPKKAIQYKNNQQASGNRPAAAGSGDIATVEGLAPSAEFEVATDLQQSLPPNMTNDIGNRSGGGGGHAPAAAAAQPPQAQSPPAAAVINIQQSLNPPQVTGGNNHQQQQQQQQQQLHTTAAVVLNEETTYVNLTSTALPAPGGGGGGFPAAASNKRTPSQVELTTGDVTNGGQNTAIDVNDPQQQVKISNL